MTMTSPQTETRPRPVNGVDVGALMDTIAAVKGNAQIAKFNFRIANKWMGGDRNRSSIGVFTGALQQHRVGQKPFEFENGEHPVLLGTDAAPNPVEWLLHGLAGCMTTSMAYHAAAHGVAITAIESDVDGDIDLRGFLGLSDKVRKGYSEIRIVMRVSTKADAKIVESFARMSPMLDVVSNSVPVKLSVETC
jgi:uncharacterized OsmC-like protein